MTAAEVGATWALPDSYAVTTGFLAMRACERFGCWPFDRSFEQLQPCEQSLLLAYERIRSAEDARLAGMGGGAHGRG